MKSIEHYITEDENYPKLNTVAYDKRGNKWRIQDICKITESRKLQDMLDEYDERGAFRKFLENKTFDTDTYIVAAGVDGASTFMPAVWLWNENGICYTNK